MTRMTDRRGNIGKGVRRALLGIALFAVGFMIGGQISKAMRQDPQPAGMLTGLAVDAAVAMMVLDYAMDRIAGRN